MATLCKVEVVDCHEHLRPAPSLRRFSKATDMTGQNVVEVRRESVSEYSPLKSRHAHHHLSFHSAHLASLPSLAPPTPTPSHPKTPTRLIKNGSLGGIIREKFAATHGPRGERKGQPGLPSISPRELGAVRAKPGIDPDGDGTATPSLPRPPLAGGCRRDAPTPPGVNKSRVHG
ncbi:hypothetical protein E2C01_065677 [Portunus trituberculatus]|uniref:Uncharacterized protein n=1 Tax=Portunus trituberculatus TaxID=210409 RepID=A0A5B7HG82_PORTR|nr:hypothetical protein [Portunus trituberculatus]